MAIIGSSDFSSSLNSPLTGVVLNNALGGTLTPAWTSTNTMYINASGSVVSGGAYSGNLVSMPTAGKMRWLYTPTGNPDNFALYALATDIISNGNAIGMLIVGRNNMRIFRTTNGSRSDLQSVNITSITAPCLLELDQTVENVLTGRILELDGTTVRHTMTQPFADLPTGSGWGLSMYGSGPDGTWDNVIFEDRPTLPSPVLTNQTGGATNSTSASGSVFTNVSGGTLYFVASTGTPDAAAVKAGQSQAVTASGVQSVAATGLTQSTTGYKLHYLHKRATGEESDIARTATFNTPATVAAPGGSAATAVDGQTVTITYTPTGTVASATASLPAHGTPNGAVTQAPLAMTLSGGVWTAVFSAVPAGDYAAPVVLASNADNPSVSITGAAAFYIDDLSGEPEAGYVETAPAFTSHPAGVSVSAGQVAIFSAVATGGGLSYQWQRNPGGNTSFSNLAGALSASYTTPATTISGGTANTGDSYRVIVTNTVASATSNAASLTVTSVAAPTITTQPASQTILSGSTVTVSVSANDGGGTLTYQWSSSPDGTTWTGVGTNAPSYTSAALTTGQSGLRFRVVVSNSAGSATSASATITVNAAVVLPTITTHPANQTIANGETAVLSVVATTGGGTLFYQWAYSSDSGATWNNVNTNGTVNPFTTLALSSAQTGIRYRVTVSNSAGGVVSNAATITVSASTVDSTAPVLSFATGSASFSSSASGSVSTTEAGGTLYWLANTSTTATGAEVKAGSSQGVSASGTQLVTATGLTANTSGYRIHFLHRDAAGNDSAVLSTTTFATPAAQAAGGFDFHTAPGMIFGDMAGGLTGLARQSNVGIVVRANNASTGAVVATSATLFTSSGGTLPRWSDTAVTAGTQYELVFKRVSDNERCITVMIAT
jgi:hypothetical protein